MPALVAIILGMLLGAACGGRLDRVGALHLRYEVAVLALFVLQALARGRLLGTRPMTIATAAWCASSILLVALLVANWGVPGAAIAAAGVLMNLVVVVLNQAMPVAVPSSASTLSPFGTFYQPAGSGTLIAWLGDTMPMKAFHSALLASPGDIALAVGVSVAIVAAMLGRAGTGAQQVVVDSADRASMH